MYGLGHAGEAGSIFGEADPTRDQADPTSCMGCELCVQQDWLRVCPNAPQVRACVLATVCGRNAPAVAWAAS